MPRFPACKNEGKRRKEKEQCAAQKLLNFVSAHINYPKRAKAKKIEGLASASFIVNPDGSIQNIKVIRVPGGGIGKELIRILKKMPKWVPGKHKGQTIAVRYTVPVRFRLNAAKKEEASSVRTALSTKNPESYTRYDSGFL